MVEPYPLTPANRLRLARAFYGVPRVDLGIASVLEGQMGRAFVDHAGSPTVFLLDLAGFFCYMAGQVDGDSGRELLAGLSPHRLLMPSSPGWIEAARDMYGERLIRLPRYSFAAEPLDISHLDRLLATSRFQDRIRRIDVPLARQLAGDPEHLFEIDSFDSAEDFVERGIGYAVLARGKCAGLAYSGLVCSRGIEISTYVAPDYRRQGLATCLAAQLCKWCLESGAEPHWDAANLESCRLAEKLGYAPAGSYYAYFLSAEGEW